MTNIQITNSSKSPIIVYDNQSTDRLLPPIELPQQVQQESHSPNENNYEISPSQPSRHNKKPHKEENKQTFLPPNPNHPHSPPLPLHLKPSGQQIGLTSTPINNNTTTPSPATLKMPTAALHNTTNTPIAKGLIGTKRAFLHGAFEFALKPFEQPIHFEMHACIDY